MGEQLPLQLRPATAADADTVAAILDDCTQRYLGQPTPVDAARERLGIGDGWIALDGGEPLGFGHVWPAPPEEVRAFVRVRPAARGRGAGSALLAAVEARARELPGSFLTATSWAEEPAGDNLLAARGYAPLRYFQQMRVDLAADADGTVDGVRRATAADHAAIFAAYVEAFADHWGTAEVDEALWWAENRDGATAGYDPELWFVAEADAEVAGFAICREKEVEGERIGWVSLVGVRPRRRGLGLGEALLRRSLDAFRARGLRRAALSVDSENTSGALRLYRKVGMEPVPAFTIWSLPLGR
jgi:mycothiol synthase